jgi:hypothetical protein
VQAHAIHSPPLRRGIAISVVLHAAFVVWLLWRVTPRSERTETELVDIDIAPAAPKVEALPAEVARQQQATEQEEIAAATPMPLPEEGALGDAGVDAAIDAPPPDAARVAKVDAAVDAAAAEDATDVVVVESGSAAGSGSDSGSGSGSGSANDPAVAGAPTTAGTAANLLAYFPPGHIITAMIRFDRLRGSEWAKHTETLLRPMPDYRLMFGTGAANIADKIDTLVISTPKPKDAAATTLVAHTKLARAPLRAFLEATTPVTWSPAKGGLLGVRGGTALAANDKRMFLSPFQGWFVLAQPRDLGGLAAPATGDLDTVVAPTAALPPWLAGIRTIESEAGTDRGPALVVTIGLPGKRFVLGDYDFGLGVKAFPTPERISAALELVKQGWLVRGNMRFASDADAAEFVAAAQQVQQRIAASTVHQLALGKPAARVIGNLSFAQTGPRVSYTTSISIADFRAIIAVAAQQLESYFKDKP